MAGRGARRALRPAPLENAKMFSGRRIRPPRRILPERVGRRGAPWRGEAPMPAAALDLPIDAPIWPPDRQRQPPAAPVPPQIPDDVPHPSPQRVHRPAVHPALARRGVQFEVDRQVVREPHVLQIRPVRRLARARQGSPCVTTDERQTATTTAGPDGAGRSKRRTPVPWLRSGPAGRTHRAAGGAVYASGGGSSARAARAARRRSQAVRVQSMATTTRATTSRTHA